MRKINFVVILSVAVFLSACSESSTSSSANSSSRTGGQPSTMAERNADGASKNESGGNAPGTVAQVSLNQAEQTNTAPVTVERKIIRNAELTLEANQPEESQAAITKIAETKGGFVVESTQSGGDAKAAKRDTVTMTIRVPAAKFDEALNEIRATASRVIIESVKGQDVTEEFIDVEARLRTQKALEAQFLELMKQSKSVDEALKVQTEIARVRGEIEKVEGRKRFLESQASLSTVKITIRTPAAFSSNAPGFFSRLTESLGRGFDAALSFILVFVTAIIALLPFLILIVLPIYLVIRYFLRRHRRQKLAGEIAREEIKTE